MEQTKRKTYLDAVRVLAFFFLGFNHVAGQSMRLFEGVGGAAALLLFYAGKFVIPLFLMVTGAAMLGREEPYGKFAKRAGRIALALILASLFYYGVQCLSTHSPFVLRDFIRTVYQSQWSNSFWYLYAYIGLLMMMPLLQRLTPALGRQEYRYIAFWTLLFSCVMPILQHIFPLLIPDSSFDLPLFSGMIGLPLIGYYMDTEMRETKLRTALAIIAPICVAAAGVALTMYDNSMFSMLDNALLLPAVVSALGTFYLFKLLDARVRLPERIQKAITRTGKLVLGAYLVSDYLVAKLQFIREALVQSLRTNFAGIVYSLIVYIAALLLSACLTRIPGLRKIL